MPRRSGTVVVTTGGSWLLNNVTPPHPMRPSRASTRRVMSAARPAPPASRPARPRHGRPREPGSVLVALLARGDGRLDRRRRARRGVGRRHGLGGRGAHRDPGPEGGRADRAAEADVLEILTEGLGVLVARGPVLRQGVQGHRVEVTADSRVVDAGWLRRLADVLVGDRDGESPWNGGRPASSSKSRHPVE